MSKNRKNKTIAFNMKESREDYFMVERMMMCNINLRKFYQQRLKLVGNVPGVILFPEFILSMNQQCIYSLPPDINVPLDARVRAIHSPQLVKVKPSNSYYYNHYNMDSNVNIHDIQTSESDNPPFGIMLRGTSGTSGINSLITHCKFNRYGSNGDNDHSWASIPLLFTSQKWAIRYLESKHRAMYNELKREIKEEKRKAREVKQKGSAAAC